MEVLLIIAEKSNILGDEGYIYTIDDDDDDDEVRI